MPLAQGQWLEEPESVATLVTEEAETELPKNLGCWGWARHHTIPSDMVVGVAKEELDFPRAPKAQTPL